jgi:hypothetical protein
MSSATAGFGARFPGDAPVDLPLRTFYADLYLDGHVLFTQRTIAPAGLPRR